MILSFNFLEQAFGGRFAPLSIYLATGRVGCIINCSQLNYRFIEFFALLNIIRNNQDQHELMRVLQCGFNWSPGIQFLNPNSLVFYSLRIRSQKTEYVTLTLGH